MMTQREKLIELLEWHYDVSHELSVAGLENLADYLLANGVVPAVRCKDCANSGEHDSELPMVYCNAFERWVHEEFYCENGAKMDKE